ALLPLQPETLIERRGDAPWPNLNHYRIIKRSTVPPRRPVWLTAKLPEDFNADSVRVLAAGSSSAIPVKVDWKVPHAKISWISTGAENYHVYFDTLRGGETTRMVEPAMIGAGERITYGRAGVRGKLAVGLWAHPAPVDMDGDGDTDLIVGCPDRPSNGIYLFKNIGSNDKPLFDRAEWLGPGKKDLVAADYNGDGFVDLVYSGGYYSDVARNKLTRPVVIDLKRDYHIGRDDLWYPADWDGDGKIDLLNGVSDWRDYGWDDAFNEKGEWLRGPLHGYIYFFRNTGSNEKPQYAAPVLLKADNRTIDQYGSPIPNPVDWLGTGRLDLLASNFIDSITLYRNTGARHQPELAAGELLKINGEVLRMDLCMIQPRVVNWHQDGRPSLIVGEEDGTVSLLENLAARGQEPRFAPPRYLEQADPYLKSGALSRPVAVDWNGDGKLDLIAGNSAGYVQFFENVGSPDRPAFVDHGYLRAGGKTIRHLAGPNGSVQGPAEIKWGYTNPSVADWDLDGKLDILVNDIWGAPVWYQNTGTAARPALAPAQPIEVEWQGVSPKPDWVWWEPKGKQLVTQWRTTPEVVDWDGDGDLDLISDSEEGPVWYENTGSRSRPVMHLRGTIIKVKLAGHNPTPNAADWNGDGRLDLIVGAEDGFLYYFERSYIQESYDQQ
ncbi:MAG: VCBS repeat-containing protein, partial [Pyrinomonadaceae bacterium]|nr:VCBS repeat-containing protein [Pyrinomonadaceae bacterium]